MRLSNNIKSYSFRIANLVKPYDLKEVDSNLSRLDSSNKFLARYASMLDINSTSKRRKRYATVNMQEKLLELLNDHPLLTYKETTIDIEVLGKAFQARIIEDSFRIIIENLLINSTYWLNQSKTIHPKLVLELDATLEKLSIYDNGIGVEPAIEEHVFEAFVTNKPVGDGRGMGLYIVSTLLNEMGATIELARERNEYGNLYKFVITFSIGGKDE